MALIIVILVFFALLLAPDIYIFGLLFPNTDFKIQHVLYFAPQLIIVGLTIIFLLETNQTIKFRHVGYSMFALLCLQLPKLIFTICSLIGKLGTLIHIPILPFSVIGIVLGLTILVALIWGWHDLYRFEVKQVEFKSKDIPQAFDGYTIVHLSDMHIGSWNRNGTQLSKAIELINNQHPDAILFTGDLVNNLPSELDTVYSILGKLQAKDGIYSVLGNHDYACYVACDRKAELAKLIEKEKNLGWNLLMNEHAIIQKGNDSIAILGVENQGKPPFPHLGNLPKALAGTEGMFRILLSHDPTHWREEVVPQTDIQLTLSGHTHASQVDFPFWSPSKGIYPEFRGLYTEGNQSLYVNIGLGFTFFPIRIGTRPEITVIKLGIMN